MTTTVDAIYENGKHLLPKVWDKDADDFFNELLKKDVILLPIPFTDLTSRKVRPAVVIRRNGVDLFLVRATRRPGRQITRYTPLSENVNYAVELVPNELKSYRSSFVHAAFFLDDLTTASMNAMPRTPSSIFG